MSFKITSILKLSLLVYFLQVCFRGWGFFLHKKKLKNIRHMKKETFYYYHRKYSPGWVHLREHSVRLWHWLGQQLHYNNRKLDQRLELHCPGYVFHIGVYCVNSTEKNIRLLPKVSNLNEDILKSGKDSSPLPSPLKSLQKVTNSTAKMKKKEKVFIMEIEKNFFLPSLGQKQKYLAYFSAQDLHYISKILLNVLHYKNDSTMTAAKAMLMQSSGCFNQNANQKIDMRTTKLASYLERKKDLSATWGGNSHRTGEGQFSVTVFPNNMVVGINASLSNTETTPSHDRQLHYYLLQSQLTVILFCELWG